MGKQLEDSATNKQNVGKQRQDDKTSDLWGESYLNSV
jgi:hypothetical protein